MISIEQIFIAAGIVFLLSVFASKASEKYGIPALLLFLFLGMLAGSEGPGGVYFDNPSLAQALGVTALAFILFSGGLDTSWSDVRPLAARGFLLSTLGVAFTSALVGLTAYYLLGSGRHAPGFHHIIDGRRRSVCGSPFAQHRLA